MNKPRIAQVLGVEVGEEFTYDFGANQVNRGAFKIGADGKRYYKTGDLWNPCYNEDDLAVIINHPDRIIRKSKQEQEEKKVDKPRICEVLGVEIGEVWTFGGDPTKFRICADGHREYYHSGRWQEGCAEFNLCDAINHPDRIIRKPRWTEQEVELAKAAKKLFPEASDLARMNACALALSNDHGGHIANINSDLFPSLPLGLCVKLDEIIGGAK